MHIRKFGWASVGQMLQHYDRTKTNTENIDSDRTQLNYNLAQTDSTQIDKIRQRIKEAPPKRRRADMNVLCDWVVTAPESLPSDREKEFFKYCYDFLAKKYGCKNVVSAYVHYDEMSKRLDGTVRAHLHFAFVPVVVIDGVERVNAKACITRKSLITIHQEMSDYLEKSMNCKVEILNNATEGGNKSIAELKRLSASRQLQEVEQSISDIEKVDNRKKESRGLTGKEPVVKLAKNDYEEILKKAKDGAEKSYIIKEQKQKIGELSWRLEQEHQNARQLSKMVIELKSRLKDVSVKYCSLCDVLKTVFEECPNFQAVFHLVKASLKKERTQTNEWNKQEAR